VTDSRRLSGDENLWLKSLSDSLDAAAGKRIAAEIERQGKAAQIQAYLYAIARANAAIIQEVTRMGDSAAVFEQALADIGWVAKWEARGEARGKNEGKNEGKLEVAKNLLDNGFSVEQTAQYAKIDIEKVRALRI
jgi:predicted transposase/invertase (TIGR01784 family)